jgi:transcriptional regulator with XRE-family HTH domain
MRLSRKKTPVQLAVRALREKVGMTQQEFSQALGVTLVTVCRWETSRPPTGYSLSELANFARLSGVREITEVFDRALREDPIARNPIRWSLSTTAQSALREIQAEKNDPAVRRAYVPILRAIERAYAVFIKRALESGIEQDRYLALERTHQNLKWELQFEKRMLEKPFLSPAIRSAISQIDEPTQERQASLEEQPEAGEEAIGRAPGLKLPDRTLTKTEGTRKGKEVGHEEKRTKEEKDTKTEKG